jgi:hypothetical protein
LPPVADFGIDSKDIEKIVVMPGEQNSRDTLRSEAIPELSFKYNAPVSALSRQA